MSILTVSHRVFLTREQRYLLFDVENIEIKVVGVSLPVWIKTHFAVKEVFCYYYITNEQKSKRIEVLEDGYRIVLGKDKKKIVDVADGGSGNVSFTLEDVYQGHTVIHYVAIKDISILERSLI